MEGIWIRSQDRKEIIFAQQLKVLPTIDQKYGIYVATCDNDTCVGYYATEERAIEVLNMIQKTITYGYPEGKRVFEMPFEMPEA